MMVIWEMNNNNHYDGMCVADDGGLDKVYYLCTAIPLSICLGGEYFVQ